VGVGEGVGEGVEGGGGGGGAVEGEGEVRAMQDHLALLCWPAESSSLSLRPFKQC
jgi:hypothetical protein